MFGDSVVYFVENLVTNVFLYDITEKGKCATTEPQERGPTLEGAAKAESRTGQYRERR